MTRLMALAHVTNQDQNLTPSIFINYLHATWIPMCKMAGQKTFTLSQVAQHRSKKDCWFVINGRVLDVTKFLDEHPAGGEVLLEVAGKDATREFTNIGHSKEAQNLLLKYQVGVLQGHAFNEADKNASFVESKHKEMSAFVIKDDKMPKYQAFLEFVLPLVFTGFYFGYRYL